MTLFTHKNHGARGKNAGLQTKDMMRLEIKEISEQGVFEGILSPYGNVDEGGDVVESGAFTKTLKEQGNERPLLWQHRPGEPIGKLTLTDTEEGLLCKGQLLLDDALPEARKAYLLIKNKIVKGLSIGFESIRDSVEGTVRHLKEVKLYEGSVVTFPMNELALITSVKKRETKSHEAKGDFSEELEERQLLDAWYQMKSALSDALCSMLYSGASREDKLVMAETIIQQFHDAFMDFLPDYLDAAAEVYGIKGRKPFETKEGRTISASTRETLATAHKCVKDAVDILSALLESDAGETDEGKPKSAATSEKKAATESAAPGDHSAVLRGIDELKETMIWTR
jgi:HK97 family phage prohead protease